MSVTHHVHGYWRRHFASLFRVLHIYLSMVSFAILFFFATTGFLLNNSDWFAGKAPRTTTSKGTVDVAWVKTKDAGSVDKLHVVERLRSAGGVRGEMHDFSVEDTECLVSFKAPGYEADATITRETGAYELTVTRDGFVAVITDLHKGDNAGTVWHWVINASAVLIILVSMTGMALIFYLKRRRFYGLVVAGVGLAVGVGIWWVFVP